MNEREKTIRLWFDMWLNQQDTPLFYRSSRKFLKCPSVVTFHPDFQ